MILSYTIFFAVLAAGVVWWMNKFFIAVDWVVDRFEAWLIARNRRTK